MKRHSLGLVFLGLTVWALLFASTKCCDADTTESTDRHESWYERAQSLAKLGKWDEAIDCYLNEVKSNSMTQKMDYKSLLWALEDALCKRPRSANAHLAYGMLKRRYYPFGGLEQEAEFKIAIALSPKQKNAEAMEWLKKCPSAPEPMFARDSKLQDNLKGVKDLKERLFLFRWSPPPSDGLLLTRVRTGKTATIIEPSTSPPFDDSVVRTVQTAIDDFPFLDWGYKEFTFISEGGRTCVFNHGDFATVTMYGEMTPDLRTKAIGV